MQIESRMNFELVKFVHTTCKDEDKQIQKIAKAKLFDYPICC